MKEALNNQMIIYQKDDGKIRIDVRFEGETMWLTQQQMAELFGCSTDNVGLHLRNLYNEGEINKVSTTEEISVVRFEGTRQINRKVTHYNLDAILSVGYRVSSKNATQFRIWASERLKEYIIKGFTMDDQRLKESGGGNYWKELLDRIRDIRSSEKVLYRQVLDLFATSVDYSPKTSESLAFFAIVQNKLHYAAHGHTAAEVIFQRVDANQAFMGLTSFGGEQPTAKDIGIAKNYLNENELKILSNLVSGYFDFAEIQAMKRKVMHMSDYIQQLDNILSATGEQLLQNAGSVSHQQALDKAKAEYRKYQIKTISSVEQAYLDSIKSLQKEISKKSS